MIKTFLLAAIKSKTFWIIFIASGLLGWIYIDNRLEVAHLNRLLANSQRDRLEQKKQDSLAVVKEVEKNRELEGVVLAKTEAIAQWKDLYFEILNARQDTTPTGAIRVSFADTSDCAIVEGYTETATPAFPEKAIIDVSLKPVGFIEEYLPVGKKIYCYIRPENDCLEFKDPKFEVPPSLFDKTRPKGFGWKEFIIGGVVVGSAVYLLSQ